MSTHNLFSWRNKEKYMYQYFLSWKKKKTLSGAMLMFVIWPVCFRHTITTLNIGIDRPEQTVYTQIRCHRMWGSDQGLHCHSSSTTLDISVGSKIK